MKSTFLNQIAVAGALAAFITAQPQVAAAGPVDAGLIAPERTGCAAAQTANQFGIQEVRPNSGERKLGRVWTNDDFAAATAAGSAADQEKSVPAASNTGRSQNPIEQNPEMQKAREDVKNEMIATAKVRRKAYDDTINDVTTKLRTEVNPFRIEVYNNILRDTLALREINNKVLEQFGEDPAKLPAPDGIKSLNPAEQEPESGKESAR